MLFQGDTMKKIQINRCGKNNRKNNKSSKETEKRERKRSLRHRFFLRPPKCRRMLSGKVSFRTSFGSICGRKTMAKASLAVETALVLPLFFMGMVTLISFMDIYRLQTEHLTKLCERAKQAGMYAYVLEGKGPGDITLPDMYSYKPIGGVIPLPAVRMHNTVKVHAWTGKEYGAESGEPEQTEPEKMVYMTDNGSVYHKNLGCSYLNLSVRQVSGSSVSGARNMYGEKYTACETCSHNQKPEGSVYITKQGNRYHNLGTCSGLKRSVRMVKESEAGDVCACSRCG